MGETTGKTTIVRAKPVTMPIYRRGETIRKMKMTTSMTIMNPRGPKLEKKNRKMTTVMTKMNPKGPKLKLEKKKR